MPYTVYRCQLFTTAETVCLSNHIKQLDFKLALVGYLFLSNYKICINNLQTSLNWLSLCKLFTSTEYNVTLKQSYKTCISVK